MSDESPPPAPAPPAQAAEKSQPAEQEAGGWGGWGLSIFSEISRNAVEVTKSAIADIQQPLEQDTGPDSGEKVEKKEPEGEGEEEERRKAALDKLENASEDSILGQGLKAFDSSVETITTSTWQALGTAWKSGSLFVQTYIPHFISTSVSAVTALNLVN